MLDFLQERAVVVLILKIGHKPEIFNSYFFLTRKLICVFIVREKIHTKYYHLNSNVPISYFFYFTKMGSYCVYYFNML